MKNKINGEKQKLTSALITLLSGEANKEVPTHEEVEEIAKQISLMFGYTNELDTVVTDVLIALVTRMGVGVSLVDEDANHDPDWVKRNGVNGVYTDAYERFLKEQGWGPELVQSLSDVTMRILGHLQDPLSDEARWNRRGLVIGHVQSGKTANYTGLIARASDSGYKFIIVIAGIHNNLRKQTQQRIDEAFIGRSSDPENRCSIGVGNIISDKYPHPATLTNINEDFNKNTAEKSGWQINDFSKPIILVIKKNVSTLSALHKWLKTLNAKKNGRISDVPMLLIDDEADNASINTNKEEINPTKTNSMIRKILGLFDKSCYVGYTATPFANIFIDPDSYDKEALEELFPKDFIHCLDAPTSYFGAEKVFIDEANSKKVIRSIDDCEELLPQSHKRDDTIIELPTSLYTAFNIFIIARAIRNLRGQKRKHCSMMINVSRFVPIQQAVRSFLSLREKQVRAAVRANYAMPEEISSKNKYMQELRLAFDNEYSNYGYSWLDVKSALFGVFDNLHLYVINSKSDEVLDYKKYEKEDIGLTAIAIGGLSLSRGLTIEGLTVSYMYRNTKMYDTLMQMGRWFGYRPGFEDLCRIYLSNDSIDWYSHIAEASEELVQQVKKMRRDGLTPKQFGLYVRSHPERLLITAANKMRSAQQESFQLSFSGKLQESHIVSTNTDVNSHNINLISEYWENGFNGKIAEPTKKGYIFRDVSIDIIVDFLTKFECHYLFDKDKMNIINYLEELIDIQPVADVLLISPPNGSGGERPFTLKNQERAVDEGRLGNNYWQLNKSRVASRGDEQLGLSDEQISEAYSLAKNDKITANVSDVHYRAVRKKPLLMLHSLSPKSDIIQGPIAAFGVSFPSGNWLQTINVVVNQVWLKQQAEGTPDNPDDEEDYDA
ncbi:Z1 domain-containing protein [Oceanobacter sp. 4_MG-2023]|uniref:Z1 domain-containing protein n=1 Tax=Oceanobacter sp. 4_MG-2023 TaxID=3062623 RepID=UPI0027352289|nr:Z1 domain-containing protein [Oceanobacter sp. 4_MG-2023]MDP2546899.1 Z1 domain-containing protein [Oceanobacter sp. 4_MG-2023]